MPASGCFCKLLLQCILHCVTEDLIVIQVTQVTVKQQSIKVILGGNIISLR